MRGFYHPKKIYAILYQERYKDEWGQIGGIMYFGEKGQVEITMGVTYLGSNAISILATASLR